MSPFSTVETINEEKKDITKIANKENVLKSAGFTPACENAKGNAGALWATTEILAMKLRIMGPSLSIKMMITQTS